MNKLQAALICLALSTGTANADPNTKYHVWFGAGTAALSIVYFNKFKPHLTNWQKTKRTYRNCVIVGAGGELAQKVSGKGVADARDVAATLIGCAAVKTTVDFNRWLIRGGKKR